MGNKNNTEDTVDIFFKIYDMRNCQKWDTYSFEC